MEQITERIREEARKLFEQDAVDLLIGYWPTGNQGVAGPCFVTDASQTAELIFDDSCTHNLATYLVGREGQLTSRFRPMNEMPRVALVARPATMRAIAGLIQENQFERDALVILGIVDGTPVGVEPDIQVGQIEEDAQERQRILDDIQSLQDLSDAERWERWEKEFAKCIRCYACRQVCPLCYCDQCIAEENQPQWIERSPSTENNRSWNIIRAFHLVGRCIDCGECDRVCPVDIPLSLLNTKMALEVQDAFNYVAGIDVEAPLPLISFQVSDPEGFIR